MSSLARPFFGYHVPSYSFPGGRTEGIFQHAAGLVQAAEAAGFDLVTVMDHFTQIEGMGLETEPMLEAYTTLGGLAARTSRVRLGTLVTSVTHRNPALLAKMVSTLDAISGGRAILGIGAGWNEAEQRAYGIEFPKVGARLDRLEEALQIARLMFDENRPSFEGRHYRIERAPNLPRPVQRGGPPILVGGMGERRTLKLAARYADLTHWSATSLDELRRKNEILARHCEVEGRDPAAILRAIGAPLLLVRTEQEGRGLRERLPREYAELAPATIEQAAERLRPYLQAGFTGFIFGSPNLNTPELIAAAGELKALLS